MLNVMDTVRALDLMRQDELESIKYWIGRGCSLDEAVDEAGLFFNDLDEWERAYVLGEDD